MPAYLLSLSQSNHLFFYRHAPGTYSHGNGWKVRVSRVLLKLTDSVVQLDISMNSCLTNYITKTFTSIGGNKWRAGSGNIYYHEGNHWDITFH